MKHVTSPSQSVSAQPTTSGDAESALRRISAHALGWRLEANAAPQLQRCQDALLESFDQTAQQLFSKTVASFLRFGSTELVN